MNVHDLRSFLGLANYFREHIESHSIIAKALFDLIPKVSNPKSILKWNESADKAFELLKDRIANCPTMFFLRDDAKIFLNTDACDYGIGAYLYQKDSQMKEYPIAFVSKLLVNSQLRWSTHEKEAYAIYYAFLQLEHLIRDVHFTLRTDHRNLTFINTEGSRKVKSWKMEIQHYNFDIEHVPGRLNPIADVLSRLVGEEQYLHGLDEIPCTNEHFSRIKSVHNEVIGHHGVERTYAKLVKLGENWPYMRQQIRSFIRTCPLCQKMSYLKPPITIMGYTTSSKAPMERLNIDTIGPLPQDEEGHCHIIVIIDTFTRFVEMYPAKDTSAKIAAKAILQHSGRYGFASEILSDNGSQFVNELITELMNLLGTEHKTTLAYSKEENAIVERINKEIMRHLRIIIYSRNIVNHWVEYLPLVQRIINSNVNVRIGVSPSQILFGNALNLERNIIDTNEIAIVAHETETSSMQNDISNNKEVHNEQPNTSSNTMANWISDMLSAQREIIRVALTTQIHYDRLHMTNRHTSYENITEYPVNSYVLVEYPTNAYSRGEPTKFHSHWRGPMKVVSNTGMEYKLLNLVTNIVETHHIKRVKPYEYDERELTPEDIALKDNQYFLVAQILAHKGNIKQKSTLRFKVKWANYGEEGNTWEPWNTLRNNLVLHQYLREKKLDKLIPPRFRSAVHSSNNTVVIPDI